MEHNGISQDWIGEDGKKQDGIEWNRSGQGQDRIGVGQDRTRQVGIRKDRIGQYRRRMRYVRMGQDRTGQDRTVQDMLGYIMIYIKIRQFKTSYMYLLTFFISFYMSLILIREYKHNILMTTIYHSFCYSMGINIDQWRSVIGRYIHNGRKRKILWQDVCGRSRCSVIVWVGILCLAFLTLHLLESTLTFIRYTIQSHLQPTTKIFSFYLY